MTLFNQGDENALHFSTDRDEDLIDSLFNKDHPDYIKCVLNLSPLKNRIMNSEIEQEILSNAEIYADKYQCDIHTAINAVSTLRSVFFQDLILSRLSLIADNLETIGVDICEAKELKEGFKNVTSMLHEIDKSLFELKQF